MSASEMPSPSTSANPREAVAVYHIRVRLFAALRELKGTDQLTLDVPVGITVGELRDLLFPPQSQGRRIPSLLYAVNQTYVSAGERLQEGDEVVFVPPVSGG